MRRASLPLVTLCVNLCALSCTRDNRQVEAIQSAAQEAHLPVAVLSIGMADGKVADRVASHISFQYGCEVFAEAVMPAFRSNEASFDELAAAVNEAIDSRASYAVCLVDFVVNKDNASGASLLGGKAVLVELSALRSNAGAEEISDEIYLRRIEKVSMSSLAELIGLADCPVPQCVLFKGAGKIDIDSKARGFCPPCMQKGRMILPKKGIRAQDDNGA